jgi:PleD family two-component response regulator
MRRVIFALGHRLIGLGLPHGKTADQAGTAAPASVEPSLAQEPAMATPWAQAWQAWQALQAHTPRPWKFLVVDDDVGVRLIITMTLEGEGFTLLEADDGSEALAIARAERPLLLLTDVAHPGLGGYELCRQIRADPDLAACGSSS